MNSARGRLRPRPAVGHTGEAREKAGSPPILSHRGEGHSQPLGTGSRPGGGQKSGRDSSHRLPGGRRRRPVRVSSGRSILSLAVGRRPQEQMSAQQLIEMLQRRGLNERLLEKLRPGASPIRSRRCPRTILPNSSCKKDIFPLPKLRTCCEPSRRSHGKSRRLMSITMPTKALPAVRSSPMGQADPTEMATAVAANPSRTTTSWSWCRSTMKKTSRAARLRTFNRN